MRHSAPAPPPASRRGVSSRWLRPVATLATLGLVVLSVAGGVTWIFAFVMFLFELLVEFLQAYVFTLLSALYIAGAVADEH